MKLLNHKEVESRINYLKLWIFRLWYKMQIMYLDNAKTSGFVDFKIKKYKLKTNT